ncbi:MAG: lamin tail domain-containing protein [Planctomycetes bacterium]|nr:lamin tail domain-containing protein [Planctomycetota bacterium]
MRRGRGNTILRSVKNLLLILALGLFVVGFLPVEDVYSAEVPLVINEFMASNSSEIRDPQGQYEDWIEIYNYGNDAIDIGGLYLTDNLSAPTKWRIPDGKPATITISARGYLLIWADNDIADSGLHANFKLSASGEEIGLFENDGSTLIDSVVFGEQTADISYGRYPDAGDNWRFFDVPSPGRQNNNAYYGEVSEVEFSHKRGFYDAPFLVTIATETDGAVIYYTLDGSDPYYYQEDHGGRNAGEIVYTNPIAINKTTCLRAKAVKPGWKTTNGAAQTYIFLDDVIVQDRQATLEAGFPSSWGGTSPDYGMDRDVIGQSREDLFGGVYARTIRDDLKSLPTMSISMNIDDMFGSGGIYTNSTSHGINWERPASVELFYPDGREGFQISCGIRIQGGYFRQHSGTKKHSLRLLFKGIYGPSKLEYPLFGEDAADSFDTIVLRAGANDGYSWSDARYTEQYTRDEFGRELQRATGNASAHGMFVHLYINGIYWGLYNPVERPDNAFSASYYGGERDDWDAIHDNAANEGDMTAWNQMIAKCRQAANSNEVYQELQGNNPDGTANPAYPNLLDVTNYVDYLIVNLWGGNWDWPWKNWWAGRDRSDSSTGFKFYCWDYENTIGNNLGRSPLNKNALNNNFSQAGVPHQSLVQNAEYRLLFADRIHKFFFNGGVLTPESLIMRYANLAAGVERAIVAESARWGDQHHNRPLTLEEWYDSDHNYNDGRAGRDWILNYYLPQRSDVVLQQLRNAGLYPNVSAPVFYVNGSYMHGGHITRDNLLSMNSSAGTIRYTLDGSDPRLAGTSQPGGITSTTLVAEDAEKRVLVPKRSISNNWKGGQPFDDSFWSVSVGSPGGVGYERSSGYQNYISLDVQEEMYNRNTSCYIRIPFEINSNDLAGFDIMTFKIRYDDGFVAYLNGTEIARRNFIGTPEWNSSASVQNTDSAAVVFENFNVSSFLDTLRSGENILAIHGLNQRTTSSDFLISAEVVVSKSSPPGDIETSPGVLQYHGPIILNNSVHIKSRVLNGGVWSALNEATFAIDPVMENLRITEFMYNPADPNTEYIELQNIGGETINLNLVKFTNGIDFTFPNMELAPNEYVVVVQDRQAFETRYGTAFNIAGQYSGRLNDGGERIKLEDAVGQTILDFDYKDGWRSITDGDGFSLTVIDPDNTEPLGWNEKDSWRGSAYLSGSPGEDDSGIVPNPGAVVINEVLAHSHADAADWIELHNTTGTAIDIGGWFLSDSSSDLAKYRIAPGTIIAPDGYIVFYEDQHFNNLSAPGAYQPFALSENGEQLYLSSAEGGLLTGYREVEDFGGSETGVSFGRHYKPSTGNYNFVPMSENTPGSENAYPKVGPIAINEIMYNPSWPVGGSYTNDQYEYIELHNISNEPVSLYNFETAQPWKFTDGIDFTFPEDVPITIPAGGYFLVVKDPEAFAWRYPAVPVENILGPYGGSLNNAGERLELSMPGDVDESGTLGYIRVDRVTYSDGVHPENSADGVDYWPTAPNGGGESLTRKVSSDYGNDSDNWIASAPSPGAANP